MKRYVSGLVIMSILLALCAGNAWAAGAAGEKGGRSAEAVSSWGALGARVSEGREADAIRIEGEIEADSEIVLEGQAIRLSGTGVIRRAAGFEGSLFTISGGSLTIADGVTLSGANAAGVTSALVSVRGGELILQAGGALQGNAGGGVYVGSGGFAMRGGRISGNRGRASGVRMVSGTFEMTGGDIVQNGGVACSYGGGVRVSGGTFTMRGGRIAENEAQSYGGGVYVGGGTAHMHGGRIAQNRAGSYGGGVYAGGGTFAVSGGVITENEARSYGGGVYVGGGTFAVSGGARVEGNASGAAQVGNVYLASGRTITISGALNGAHLGVSAARGRVGSLISGEFEGAWATEAHFTGDNPAYAIAHVQGANGKATLRLKAGKPNAPLIRVQPVAPAPTSYAGVSGRLSIVSERAPLNGGERLVYAWHKSVTGSINASDAVVGACATYDLPPGLAAGTHYYYCRVTASQGGAPSSGAVNSTVVAVRVLPRSIADATLEVASAIYIGAPILPQITVTDGSITLVEGVDYAVRHENNTLAASAASEKPPTVTISGLGNYDPATQRTQSFTIDKAEIRVNGGKICAKAYDGSADARVEALTFEGLAGNEMLTIGIDYTAGAPAFDSARAGHGDKIVTGTAALVAGGKADNYRLSGAYRLTGASITPRLAVLRWSGIATRTYDASAATVGATVENPVAGEHCGVFVTGGDAKNAGTHTATAGLDNGNYALSENAAQRYVIEKAVLTPRIGTKDGPVARAYRPNDKTFEGAAIELSGAVAGEHPTATARIEFVDADAGSDKPANARDIRLGDWSANYALSSDAIAGQRVRGACVLAASQAAPCAPTCLSRTATRVALSAVEGASYRCGGAGAQDASGAWQRAPIFEGLAPGTAYAFCAYYPEKPNYRASDAGAKAIFYTCAEAPTAENCAPDYARETFSFDDHCEAGRRFGDYALPSGAAITPGETLHVRVRAVDGGAPESVAIDVPLPARPQAPSAVASVPAQAAADDGALTGVTREMQYKEKTETDWTGGTGAAVKSLAAGDYLVRFRATATAFASENQAVTILKKNPTPQAAFDASVMALSGVTAAMAYSLDGGGTWMTCAAESVPLSGVVTAARGIRVKQSGDRQATADSEIQVLDIAQAAKPTALAATRTKTDNGTDGTIAGVTARMEYRKAPDKAWTTCAEGAQIHLAKGVYEVRVKGAGMALASEAASLLVMPPAEKATQPVAVGHVLSPVTVPDDAENSEALEAAVLDAAEKKAIAAGSATIAIAMTAAEAPVAADVHEALCASPAGGAVPAADTYLKFHVNKAIHTGETTEERPVTRLSSPFALTLGVPPALRGHGYAFGVAQVVEAASVPGAQAEPTAVGARAGGKARSTRLSLQPLAVKRASDAEVTVILPKDTAIPVTLVLIYTPKPGGGDSGGGGGGTSEPSAEFVITATAGAHGAIAPAGEVVVSKGASQRFELAADAGYEIDLVTVDGAKATLDARNHYVFESVEAPHAIHATFKARSGEPDVPDIPDIPDIKADLELALLKGKKAKLSALTNLTGTWTIDRPEIAVIGKKGVLTAKKPGDAVLTFTAGKAAGEGATLLARPMAAGDVLTLKLHVVKKGRAVTGFELSAKALSLAPEQSARLVPKLKPATAQYKRVYFSSLDPRVATVDAQGVVTAIAPGKTAIRAIATNGQVKMIPIVVSDKPISLKLSAKKKAVRVGKTVQLTAQLAPAGLCADVVWRSANEAIATVSPSGLVTALARGNTTIYATHPATGLTAKCKLKVKARK